MSEGMISIKFFPDFKNVDTARSVISCLCEPELGGDGTEEFILEFLLAATEAMNNAVEHSGSPIIEVHVTPGKSGISMSIITEGERFDPTVYDIKPDMDDDDSFPEGGFGIDIIKNLTDSVKYEYVNGRNVLTLKKSLVNRA